MAVAGLLGRHPGRTLHRSIAREARTPTLVALVGLTIVVLTKDFLGLSDLVLNRGFSLADVGEILFLEAIVFTAVMFPFAVLVGAMVALGRLGADREILALEASGVSAARLIGPIGAFAARMTVVALLLSAVAAPWASRALDRVLVEASRDKPWAQIRAGLVQKFGGWQLETREASARGDVLKGILLWMPDVGETIFAHGGKLETTEDGAIRITITDGSVLLSPRGGPREIRFDALTTELPDSDEPVTRREEDRIRGLPLRDLLKQAKEAKFTQGEDLPVALVELHHRFAFPVATLAFGLLAAPLFLTRRSFSRAGGGVLGILCTIAYYGLAQLGEGLAQSGLVTIAAGIWFPNVLIALLALALFLYVRGERVLGHAFTRSRSEAKPARPVTLETRWTRRYPLPRYITSRFSQVALLTFSVLVVAYLVIDVMERLSWFAEHGASGIEVLRFYGARIPLLASRVVPMALLVATSLTVSLLAAEGELVGMRSCGIPAPKALLPLLAISALVAPAYFLLNNEIVPRTNALADYLKKTEIKDDVYSVIRERKKEDVWYRDGNHVIEAQRFDTDLGEATDLTIYDIGDDGLPVGRTDARSARHDGGGLWRLDDAIRIELGADGLVHEVPPPAFIQLGETLPSELDTMQLSVGQLAREIDHVEASGYDATPLRVDRHVKLAAPLACILLPAIVLLYAVGGPPYPGPAQNLLVSGIIGVGFILVTGVSASLGYGGRVPSVVGGWAPIALIGGVTGWLGARVWRRS